MLEFRDPRAGASTALRLRLQPVVRLAPAKAGTPAHGQSYIKRAIGAQAGVASGRDFYCRRFAVLFDRDYNAEREAEAADEHERDYLAGEVFPAVGTRGGLGSWRDTLTPCPSPGGRGEIVVLAPRCFRAD